jgi:hypothetical protein
MKPEITGLKEIQERQERRIKEAYQLGLFHGINASSMARVEKEVMEFEDYGWSLDGE